MPDGQAASVGVSALSQGVSTLRWLGCHGEAPGAGGKKACWLISKVPSSVIRDCELGGSSLLGAQSGACAVGAWDAGGGVRPGGMLALDRLGCKVEAGWTSRSLPSSRCWTQWTG